jgi:hypothetical protein
MYKSLWLEKAMIGDSEVSKGQTGVPKAHAGGGMRSATRGISGNGVGSGVSSLIGGIGVPQVRCMSVHGLQTSKNKC